MFKCECLNFLVALRSGGLSSFGFPVHRAIPAALNASQLEDPTLSQGTKILICHHLSPQRKLRSPKWKYEALEIREIGGPLK